MAPESRCGNRVFARHRARGQGAQKAEAEDFDDRHTNFTPFSLKT